MTPSIDQLIDAFDRERIAAAALAAHKKTCRVCRSRILSFFTICEEGENLATEAELMKHFVDAWKAISRLNKIPKNLTPSAQWCEQLYKL